MLLPFEETFIAYVDAETLQEEEIRSDQAVVSVGDHELASVLVEAEVELDVTRTPCSYLNAVGRHQFRAVGRRHSAVSVCWYFKMQPFSAHVRS